MPRSGSLPRAGSRREQRQYNARSVGCNRAAATVQRRKPILLAVRAALRGCDQINGGTS